MIAPARTGARPHRRESNERLGCERAAEAADEAANDKDASEGPVIRQEKGG